MYPRPSGFVTLTSEFGAADAYVGIMKGAIARASAKPQVIDLCHGVSPGDIAAGAFALWSAIGRFPDGCVHCAVVGAGGADDRRLLAACAHGQYWLAPDSGVLGSVLAGDDRAEVRGVNLERLGLKRGVTACAGRDVFAPVAAMLSTGRYGFSAIGPRVEDAVAPDLVFSGGDRVLHVDHCGNLVTNVVAARIASGCLRIAGAEVPLQPALRAGADGRLCVRVGSLGLMEVAASSGSAAASLGVGRGEPVALAPA